MLNYLYTYSGAGSSLLSCSNRGVFTGTTTGEILVLKGGVGSHNGHLKILSEKTKRNIKTVDE